MDKTYVGCDFYCAVDLGAGPISEVFSSHSSRKAHLRRAEYLLNMTTEITYAEEKIQNDPQSLDIPNEPKSSDTPSEAPVAPEEKRNPLQSKPDFHKLLIPFLLILLLAVSFFIAFVGKKWSCCPENWMSFGSNCYFISTEETTWEKSKKNCEGMQAHLLVINSKEEQDFITKTVNKTTYFIGLLRSQDRSHWQWIDQTPFNTSISFWLPGEPNDINEPCGTLHFNNKWGWNDLRCDRQHRSICKMMKYSS
ncbi:C-type lectin domain family 4 member A [Suncus etruscus]|uniref:C-type lectin domain family 4 member A n=1 Tax=Suncus etruscus TaxID=109475 RepID=UPI00210F2495|nr:C-type lectin domain family 4 member A [Suncus etruscus]